MAESSSVEDEGGADVLDVEPCTPDRSTSEALCQNVAQVFAADDAFFGPVKRNLFSTACRIPIQNLNSVESRADARAHILVQSGDDAGLGRFVAPHRMCALRGPVIGKRDQVRTALSAPHLVGSTGTPAAVGMEERVGRPASKPQNRRCRSLHRLG